MTYLNEAAEWDEQIYELQTIDAVLGGTEGISNRQASQLGNRTQWLKKQLAEHDRAENPHPQYKDATNDLEIKLNQKITDLADDLAYELNPKIADLADDLRVLRNNMGELWGSLTAPEGTLIVFAQTSAPVGWTKVIEHNDKALRIVSGIAGSGGSLAFSSAFAASRGISGSVDNTTLTVNQMPSHNHGIATGAGGLSTSYAGHPGAGTHIFSAYTGGSGAHTHSLGGAALNMEVQYVDAIIARKD